MESKPWQDKILDSLEISIGNAYNDNNLLDGTNNLQQDNSNNFKDTCKKDAQKDVKLEENIQASISDKGRQKIQSILELVNTLNPLEKLLLYLKLPTENQGSTPDPLRQSLNPLGSRSEISATITWIQTHLEEDKELSLQKKGVYDDYTEFCVHNGIKPLSTADFGKVMKQVYPNVRPRRLGTRGKSKYCYSGLRSRLKLGIPFLPNLEEKLLSTEESFTQTDLMAASWILIKEWVEEKLSRHFKSLTSLAYFLVKEFSVGTGTEAAKLISSAANIHSKDRADFVNINKHKEAALQLQRKLHRKCEANKETKRKQSPKLEMKSRKKGKVSSASTSCSTSPVAASEIKCSPQPQENSRICDSTSMQSLPDFNCFQRPPNSTDTHRKDNTTPHPTKGDFNIGKVAIPRITKAPFISSPKRQKHVRCKTIQPKPDSCGFTQCNPSKPTFSTIDIGSQENASKTGKIKNSPSLLIQEEESTLFSRERLISIGQVSKDALDEYLGTSNSQEQEEEIMQYFGNNNDDQDKTKKISQLRQLLEKSRIAQHQNVNVKLSTQSSNSFGKSKPVFKPTIPSQPLHVKRRVSFDTQIYEDSVPASPNTRRQNINFIPISPSSPNDRQSKCSSTNASPFVSPRNTPVARGRVNATAFFAKSTLPNFKYERHKKMELEMHEEAEFRKSQLNILPMSAPPSPKIYNTYNKGADSFPPQILMNDSLSAEVSKFSSNNPSANLDTTLRSQSVPVNAIANQFLNNLSFINEHNSISNEFNDIDFNNENINVNKIIEDIDQTNLDILMNEMNSSRTQIGDGVTPIQNDLIVNNANERLVGIDYDDTGYADVKLPSRSVPCTPLSFNSNINAHAFNKNYGSHNSKSYPSTPLMLTEPFSYNVAQDYLLNGQPIKSKLEYVEEDKEDVFDGDLMDNKNNLYFEGPITGNNFGAKQNENPDF